MQWREIGFFLHREEKLSISVVIRFEPPDDGGFPEETNHLLKALPEVL